MEFESILCMITLLLTSVSLIILAYQLRVMRRTYIDEHEKCRREKAIELLRDWTKEISYGTAEKNFVEKLNEEQCKKIWKEGNLEIDRK
jgi:hypothetical protein